MKKCPACDRENLEGANFCDRCGARLRKKALASSINTAAPIAYLEVGVLDRKYEIFPDMDVLIGRGDQEKGLLPDIMFPSRKALEYGVSRVHAKIFCQGNNYHVGDLDSTNSVILNGKKLAPQVPYQLNDGDVLEFGLLEAVFRLGRGP
jgi:pSer/pThr/pTyr-binding forkhead associated (FHA) protein